MNDYEAKREARIERMRERADAKRAEASSAISTAEKMADVIPFGQPILLGHHSERRDRNYRNRISSKFEKGFAAMKEAEDLDRRASNAENNRMISADDPDAVTKLKAKRDELAADRSRYVEMNKTIRTAKSAAARSGKDWKEIATGALGDMGVSAALAAELIAPDFMGRIGVPPYKLSNMGNAIRSIDARIAQLQRDAIKPPAEPIVVGEVRIEEAENRVRIIFPGKPSEETRTLLKGRGFRWSPIAGAWQRQATNAARYDAMVIASQLVAKAT